MGDKDRVMKFKICRKEAKECQLFLRLVNVGKKLNTDGQRAALRQEALELKLIFSSIVKKLE